MMNYENREEIVKDFNKFIKGVYTILIVLFVFAFGITLYDLFYYEGDIGYFDSNIFILIILIISLLTNLRLFKFLFEIVTTEWDDD